MFKTLQGTPDNASWVYRPAATMATPHPQPPNDGDQRFAELRRRWIDRYGRLVAAQLEPDRRYSLIRVGSAEYAYTSYSHHVRALGQAWSSGLVPEPLPSTLGSELLDVAPNLKGVDADLDDVRAGDVERP
jgi:hypothetical protein